VIKEIKVTRVIPEPKEFKVFKVKPELKEFRVYKVIQEPKVTLEQQVLRVQ
tara:strand:- start:217 stop:369 length:153 start_codon:yes stop_codon:yes gene_type:complete